MGLSRPLYVWCLIRWSDWQTIEKPIIIEGVGEWETKDSSRDADAQSSLPDWLSPVLGILKVWKIANKLVPLHLPKCIWKNWKIYLPKLKKIICPNCKMNLSKLHKYFSKLLREGVKKKLLKSGQADRLGRPPLPLPEAVRKMWKFSTLTFDFRFWLYTTRNEFYPKKLFLTTDPLRSISRHSMIFTVLAVLGQLKRH